MRSKQRLGRRRRVFGKKQRPRNCRVLLPLSRIAEAEALFPLAQALARQRQGEIILLCIVTVARGRSLSEATAEASRTRQELNEFMSHLNNPRVVSMVRVAWEAWDAIWETVEQERISLLLLAWQSEALPETVVGVPAHPQLATPPCDVVIVRPGTTFSSSQDWQSMQRILLAVRGGPHAAVSLRVGQATAEAWNATITLLHTTGKAPRDTEEQLFAAFGPALRGLERVTRSVTTVGEVPQAIIEESQGYQLLVMGAPTRGVAPSDWRSAMLNTVVSGTDATVVIAKASSTVKDAVAEISAESPHHDRPAAVVVDKWFAENTFHSREFADLGRLVALKKELDLTISLGLPALNEEQTIGKVIQTIKTALMDEVALLDEIVLIDSGSVDYTREIAADLGVPVHIHQEILPRHGAYTGKGEALWKSLYVLKGDLIAWIDTDIENIHPRFVYGILGPLLRNPQIQYVKGFYRRPLRQGDRLVAGGGGRVTELTARPLINLFFPELSGLIQPLSGEYAGRRQALEQIPFFTGYGVETGLLVDILEAFGLQSIAQVDLQERIHRNKPLPALSPMSFAIIQVIIRQLEDRHRIGLLEEVNKTMNLIRYEPKRFYLETIGVREQERPPMITLPEYRQKRGLPAMSANQPVQQPEELDA